MSSYFKLDTSQVLINRVFPLGSGSAVEFFVLFPEDEDAEAFEQTMEDPQRLIAVFAGAPALSNPRLASADASSSASSSPAMNTQGACDTRG